MTRVMIVCAEASGDLLASELIDGLRHECPNIEFTDSFIGSECQKKGLRTIADLSSIAKMGFAEIITLIPTIYRLRKTILNVIAQQKPTAIIMVDGFAFTHFIAKKIKKNYPHIKIIKYIAPKLWAWAAWRAYKLRIYDLILVCLPFERAFFAKKNIKTHFVGHSVTQRITQINDSEKHALRQKYNIPDDKKIIVLLAGSRHSEIRFLLPIFQNVAQKFDPQKHHFFVPITTNKAHYFSHLPNYYTRITDTDERFKIFQIADIALAASGTVSLELMLCKVPTVIAYKVSWLTSKIASLLINVKYVTLLNLMVDKLVFPEFIQENCHVDSLFNAVHNGLYNSETIKMQKKYCDIGTNLLYTTDKNGKKIPANTAAALEIKKIL